MEECDIDRELADLSRQIARLKLMRDSRLPPKDVYIKVGMSHEFKAKVTLAAKVRKVSCAALIRDLLDDWMKKEAL
jgi:hypothetical protein